MHDTARADAKSRSGTLAITGTPGTGKHTISRIISTSLGIPVLDISQVSADHGLAGPDGVDTTALAEIIRRSPGRSIVVGHLAPHIIHPGSLEAAVVLRRSPYELEETYRSRGYTRRKALDNLGAEILDIVAYEAASVFGDRATQVDTTGDSAQETAGKALRAMSGDYTSDRVDWLDMVQRNGDMGRFFVME